MKYQDLLNTFKLQPDLNRKIWNDDDRLHTSVRSALLLIADEFYNSIELENKPPVKDVVLTGSLANYNYSVLSDLDLHLIFDFSQFGEYKDVFEKLFLLAKSSWNLKHNIKVKGFEVEIYAEDEKSTHHSTGMYSVLHDSWIRIPSRTVPKFNGEAIKSKIKYYLAVYNNIRLESKNDSPETTLKKIEMLRDKINKGRKSGLLVGGQYSIENMVFKALRRMGILDKLALVQTTLQDKILSVETAAVDKSK